ncbi:MAG: hypothetical protein KF822_09425 [Steroidobacteraceae bacterium]|nr:hypothetical protein [Steroidobacteraceae bacterium]
MTDIRTHMLAWRDWRQGKGPQTPEVERIEAVYQSGLLSPGLHQIIDLVYLDERRQKQKYASLGGTSYYAQRKAAEEMVGHLAAKLGESTEI